MAMSTRGCFVLFSNDVLPTSTFGRKRLSTRHGEARPSTFGRGPGVTRAPSSAWRALKLFFRRERTGRMSLVSVREALFCTYVPVKCRQLLSPFHEHTAQTCTRRTRNNRQRAKRENAAARKHQQEIRCVCGTAVRALQLWLAVFVGACGP